MRLGDLADLARNLELGHTDVIRWSGYRKTVPGLRKQTNAQHLLSLTRVAHMVVAYLESVDFTFNQGIILRCAALHDDGEIHCGDTQYGLRGAEAMVAELEAFKRLHQEVPQNVFSWFLNAYLLHFVLEEDVHLTGQEGEILARLREVNRREAIVFNLIERVDYIVFTLGEAAANRWPLEQVLINQVPKIKALVEEEPELKYIPMVKEILKGEL